MTQPTDRIFDANTPHTSLLDKCSHPPSTFITPGTITPGTKWIQRRMKASRAFKQQLVSSWREDEILLAFKQAPKFTLTSSDLTGFVFPAKHPIVYIKFCYPPARGMAEAKNYDYAFRALKAMPPNQTQGIFIPEIYRTFQNDDTFFIIMDYIPGRTLTQLQEQQDWDSKKRHSSTILQELSSYLCQYNHLQGKSLALSVVVILGTPCLRMICPFASTHQLKSLRST